MRWMPLLASGRSTWNVGGRLDWAARRASAASAALPNPGRFSSLGAASRASRAAATWNDPSALVVAPGAAAGLPVFHVEQPTWQASAPASCSLRSTAGCSTWNSQPGQASAPASCSLRSTAGCSTWNSELRAQKRGRFAGTPGLRAYRSGQGSTCSSAWYRNPSDHDHPTARPSRASPGAAHRDASGGAPESPSGGSLTASVPPTRRKGAPHSAVTAGGPKPLATTRSNAPRR
jgi:hypothetical protein